MSLKKVYIEITNNCNLNCSFCIHNKREAKYMSMNEFKIILSKLKVMASISDTSICKT